MSWRKQVRKLLEAGSTQISTIKPSDWAESNIIMGKPFPGKFQYSRTPYTREIIDCLSPDHPAKVVSVKKGAQIGFSAGVIYPALGWIISNSPANTMVTVGSPELIEKAMEKIDMMIDSSKIRGLIKSSVNRKKNQKTGDTNDKKEFVGGYVTVKSINNHKSIRQVDLQYLFIDDFESSKRASKESGDTRKLIEQRTAAYANKSKIFYISTPEIHDTSNIEPVYLLGDQRKYMIPCQHCGDHIDLKWSHSTDDFTAGLTWKEDSGRLIRDSVGYICQSCGGFFDDRKKMQFLNDGFWRPTEIPMSEGNYSYHISSLYAPHGMFDWRHYVEMYIEANPKDADRKEHIYKTFVNLCLGETYKPPTTTVRASALQKNQRDYPIGMVPDKMSISDDNGQIVLMTMAVDLNGTVEDCRIDYEVVAWSENGCSYSVDAGSIGTFIPKVLGGNTTNERDILTYEHNASNSVWPRLKALIDVVYESESGQMRKVMFTGIDTGHFTDYAYSFIDNTPMTLALKGDKPDQAILASIDAPYYKKGKERANLYLVQPNLTKDKVAAQMNYFVKPTGMEEGTLCFPTPSMGKYTYSGFFEHFESEHKVFNETQSGVVKFMWQKKSPQHQNHFWDCRVYNFAVKEIAKDIIVNEVDKSIRKPTWSDFVDMMTGRYGG